MSKKRIFSILLIVILFTLFAFSAIFQDMFFRITGRLEAYEHLHPSLGPLVFIGLAMVSALLSPFSSTPLVPSAVVIWGAEKTAILLFIGWILGSIFSYGIGYYLGYPVVKKIASKKSLDKWVEILSNKVDVATALLFRLATPSETGYVFGTLKYNFFKYFFITFLAELPFVYIAVYLSEAFINAGWLAFLVLGCAWLFMISVAIHLLNKRLRN